MDKIIHIIFIILTFYLFFHYKDVIILLYCIFAISLAQKRIFYSIRLECTNKTYEEWIKLAFAVGVISAVIFLYLLECLSLFL